MVASLLSATYFAATFLLELSLSPKGSDFFFSIKQIDSSLYSNDYASETIQTVAFKLSICFKQMFELLSFRSTKIYIHSCRRKLLPIKIITSNSIYQWFLKNCTELSVRHFSKITKLARTFVWNLKVMEVQPTHPA